MYDVPGGNIGMGLRFFCPALVGVLCFGTIALAQSQARGSGKAWMPSRTADGQPDLEGVWAIDTLTPLERPAELAGKAVLTEAEVAAYEKRVLQETNRDRRDGNS